MSDEPKPVWLALCVELFEAKPNKLFTEDHRQLVRFLRYNSSVPCAECGRKGRAFWTMLCSFQAQDLGQFTVTGSGKVHLPLTQVCQKHLLAAETVDHPPYNARKKQHGAAT